MVLLTSGALQNFTMVMEDKTSTRYQTVSVYVLVGGLGGRFKKEVIVDGLSYLLLIRDEGGSPDMQVGDDAVHTLLSMLCVICFTAQSSLMLDAVRADMLITDVTRQSKRPT